KYIHFFLSVQENVLFSEKFPSHAPDFFTTTVDFLRQLRIFFKTTKTTGTTERTDATADVTR
ncbi:MAG: hypothetical protein PUF55_03420, partial [Bacteroidales bacterium]|nr:hypothetical protein [Bacteroidales bacterium]